MANRYCTIRRADMNSVFIVVRKKENEYFYSEVDFLAVTRNLHRMDFGGAEFLFIGTTPNRARDPTRHPKSPQSNSDASYVRTRTSSLLKTTKKHITNIAYKFGSRNS
jgi:hypothetical protein